MGIVWDVLTWACFLAGSFFAVTGGIGIVRLPDFFARVHGGSITDTLGAGLILLGLMFQAGISLATLKLLMILVFFWLTTPSSSHALAHAALTQGVKPWSGKEAERAG